MTATLVHRGPDGSGEFFDPQAGIGFGHRRLSIVDLSDAGRQPMWSRSGRYCITYNGEIYNAPELRRELERADATLAWRGHSDTEALLEAIEALGLERALGRCHGMFAFALWDAQTRRLLLVRDRLGIKPLVYVRGNFGIAFASELRAFQELPGFRARLDRSALASFLQYGVVPGNECIIRGARKVRPGAIVEFNNPFDAGATQVFWSPERIAAAGISKPFSGTPEDAIDELKRRIARAVMMRMRADVPYGAFLSGGIDSSTVVSMMQAQTSAPVKTFCIGNALEGYDEASHAEAVARHLGTDHHTLLADPAELHALVPDVASHWDEPFADSSQIPTFLVSRLTRSHVTVVLSGDGGDELFAGYNRHAWVPRLWRFAARVPRSARHALKALELVGVEDWDRAFRALGLSNAVRLPGDKLHKLAALAEATTSHDFYQSLRSHWLRPQEVLADGDPPRDLPSSVALEGPLAAQIMLQDLMEYLPDDILTKVDRASMAVSLEARVPLLDHDIVEFAWRLPMQWKVQGRTQKWILRQVLARHVPAELFKRPKMGFGVPVGQWLRGPLRRWAAELLDQDRLRAEGIFDAAVVDRVWQAHQQGRGNHEHRLWAVLMFQSWWHNNRKFIES